MLSKVLCASPPALIQIPETSLKTDDYSIPFRQMRRVHDPLLKGRGCTHMFQARLMVNKQEV